MRVKSDSNLGVSTQIPIVLRHVFGKWKMLVTSEKNSHRTFQEGCITIIGRPISLF